MKKRYTVKDKKVVAREMLRLAGKLFPKWIESGTIDAHYADFFYNGMSCIANDYENAYKQQQAQIGIFEGAK